MRKITLHPQQRAIDALLEIISDPNCTVVNYRMNKVFEAYFKTMVISYENYHLNIQNRDSNIHYTTQVTYEQNIMIRDAIDKRMSWDEDQIYIEIFGDKGASAFLTIDQVEDIKSKNYDESPYVSIDNILSDHYNQSIDEIQQDRDYIKKYEIIQSIYNQPNHISKHTFKK